MSTTLLPEEVNAINAINQYRQQNNVPPLQVSAALTQSAKWMANDMATKNYLSHTDSQNRDPFQRMNAFGYTYATTKRGENVAAGDQTGQSTFAQWRDACDPDSTGKCTYAHRNNMLDPAYKVIGVGQANNPNSTYGYYWTSDFGGTVDSTLPLVSSGVGENVSPPLQQITQAPPYPGGGQNIPSIQPQRVTPFSQQPFQNPFAPQQNQQRATPFAPQQTQQPFQTPFAQQPSQNPFTPQQPSQNPFVQQQIPRQRATPFAQQPSQNPFGPRQQIPPQNPFAPQQIQQQQGAQTIPSIQPQQSTGGLRLPGISPLTQPYQQIPKPIDIMTDLPEYQQYSDFQPGVQRLDESAGQVTGKVIFWILLIALIFFIVYLIAMKSRR